MQLLWSIAMKEEFGSFLGEMPRPGVPRRFCFLKEREPVLYTRQMGFLDFFDLFPFLFVFFAFFAFFVSYFRGLQEDGHLA
ncbi:hypothetical protein ACOMHN_031003 [Nucella lapillus]